jgi:hypothetical protein
LNTGKYTEVIFTYLEKFSSVDDTLSNSSKVKAGDAYAGEKNQPKEAL